MCHPVAPPGNHPFFCCFSDSLSLVSGLHYVARFFPLPCLLVLKQFNHYVPQYGFLYVCVAYGLFLNLCQNFMICVLITFFKLGNFLATVSSNIISTSFSPVLLGLHIIGIDTFSLCPT